ncbi:hypothetical protein [Desulfovibrio sp. JC010]|uniref:hypothetical protein n=1 Tax=Desulfovibrio sp. JC010 TaxID=2593641 RepID=UPI0013D3A7F7|nr:hypothetical protein [Desulfovibrio sp. JC010]NDV28807.1 hypothetical protein [Desulfovibrio sp. JC010]
MLRLLTVLITILLLPALALAWPGKIVAVEGAATFVVLKDGQTPVKVNVAGVRPSANLDPAKARMESSSNVLMREVEVRELSKADDGTIIGDITVDGKSLAKELLDEGIVESTAQAAPAIDTTPVEIPKEISEPETAPVPETAPQATAPTSEASASEIANELLPAESYQAQPETPPVPAQQAAPPPLRAEPESVRYVQVYQAPQQLGLWPGRPAPVAAPQPVQQTYATQQPVYQTAQTTAPVMAPHAAASQMQQPGDTAKRDYELAVRVQKNTRRTKRKGFFVPKKKSETFVGASGGFQASLKSNDKEPYSSFGGLGGFTTRHFFPSGFGIGGDFFMSSTTGNSGTYGATYYDNGTLQTNGTAYDYKNKKFNTYTFTGSLLYRFYTDRQFTPYVAAHGGYSVFDYPGTIFKLSDGAPVAGAGAGFLYEFDSGFTVGFDTRYLKTIGGKKNDPSGFFDSMFNIGFTFD